MKVSALCLASALLLTACGGGEEEATAENPQPGAGNVASDVPELKPGRWRVTVVSETGPQFPPETICLTEADARAKKGLGERAAELPCEQRNVARDGDAVVTRAICNVGGVTRTIESRAQGDFQLAYNVNYVESLDPPPPDGPPEIRRRLVVRWMGECE